MSGGPRSVAAVLALAGALLSSPASANRATSGEHASRLRSSYLTGDWGGRRAELNERGIIPFARYTSGVWSNLHGGFETGTRYEGFAQWGVDLDLDLMAGWKGLRFYADWYSYHGGQPSEDLVGPFPSSTVSGWETSESIRFHAIWLEKEWMRGRLLLRAGQLAADDAFFISDSADALLNGTFGFLGLGRANGIVPFYPLAAPGLYARIAGPEKEWVGHVGVYTADPGDDTSGNHGFDWTFDNGASILAEAHTHRMISGRRGKFALGGLVTTAELENFETAGTSRGGYGLYGLIDQALTPHGSDDPMIGVFLRSYGAPQTDRAQSHYYVDAGLKVEGFIPGRAKDLLILALAFVAFSDDYVDSQRAEGSAVSRHQGLFEAAVRVQVTGWLTLQPDLQIFFDPHFSRRDAVVVGLRAVMDL